ATGSAAIATVPARVPTRALVIDDPTLARLEREQPVTAARLLRRLAEIAEQRKSDDPVLIWSTWWRESHQAVEVRLCRNKEMLESAQRLRYQVYSRELGRSSMHADHEREIISDTLDEPSRPFIAVEAGETIATLRGNVSSDTSLGVIEELYGMRASPHHPGATAICTKFVVKKSKRGGPAAMKLISAMIYYGLRQGIRECYIDSIPALLPYYKAMGLRISGEKFVHRENGPSYPMVIDVERQGRKLAELADEPGLRGYLTLIVKAKAIKLLDRVRGRV